MRVHRRHRGPVTGRDHQNFWIYDENELVPQDEEERLREKYPFVPAWASNRGIDEDTWFKELAARCEENGKIIWGPAYGHKLLAHFTVHRDGNIEFEFDNEYQYSIAELTTMLIRAKAASKRLVWA